MALFQDEETIRRRIGRRNRRRMWLMLNVTAFIVATILLATIGPRLLAPPIWQAPSVWVLWGWVVWLVIIFLHGIKSMFDEATDRAVQRELERERMLYYQAVSGGEKEKPKRDAALRLGEDGELIEVTDEEQEHRRVKGRST